MKLVFSQFLKSVILCFFLVSIIIFCTLGKTQTMNKSFVLERCNSFLILDYFVVPRHMGRDLTQTKIFDSTNFPRCFQILFSCFVSPVLSFVSPVPSCVSSVSPGLDLTLSEHSVPDHLTFSHFLSVHMSQIHQICM